MTSMKELVARAICQRLVGCKSGALILSEIDAADLAEAAISAMREPTQEMREAAWSIGFITKDADDCWAQMIHVALNEGSNGEPA